MASPREHQGAVVRGFSHQPFNCGQCGENYIALYECLDDDQDPEPAYVAQCWCGSMAFVPQSRCEVDRDA